MKLIIILFYHFLSNKLNSNVKSNNKLQIPNGNLCFDTRLKQNGKFESTDPHRLKKIKGPHHLFYQLGIIKHRYVNYYTAIMDESIQNILSHESDPMHYKDWLGYSLIPELFTCAKIEIDKVNSQTDKLGSKSKKYYKKQISFENIDCKCGSSNLSEAEIDTLDCIDQKVKFTASLIAIRFTCDNKDQLMNHDHQQAPEDNSKKQFLSWEFQTIASTYALRLVEGCIEEAKSLANDTDKENRSISLDFLNICLNSLQNCIGFSIDQEKDANGNRTLKKQGCNIQNEHQSLMTSVVKRIKTSERRRKKLNFLSIGVNISLGVATMFASDEPKKWIIPTMFFQGLVTYLFEKKSQHRETRLAGKQMHLSLSDLKSITGLVLSTIDTSIPNTFQSMIEMIGNLNDIIEATESVEDVLQIYNEQNASGHEHNEKWLRKLHFEIYSSVYESMVKLSVIRSDNVLNNGKELWALDHRMLMHDKKKLVHEEFQEHVTNVEDDNPQKILESIKNRKEERRHQHVITIERDLSGIEEFIDFFNFEKHGIHHGSSHDAKEHHQN